MGELDDLKKRIVEDVTIGGVMDTIPLSETVNKLIKYFTKKYKAQELKDYEDLILELSKVNREFFMYECYPKLIKRLLKKFPVEDILQIERNIVLNSMNNIEGLIINDYFGKLKLPEIELVLEGHIFISNLFICGIMWGWGGFSGTEVALALVTSGVVGAALNNMIIKRRKYFFAAIEQYFETLEKYFDLDFYSEKIPFIPIIAPYNISTYNSNLSFSVNYVYSYKKKELIKNRTVTSRFTIAPTKYKKESAKDFKQRTESLFSAIKDTLLKNPYTTCSKCNHLQNKTLVNCEKCGMLL